jgi:hypothetical protein
MSPFYLKMETESSLYFKTTFWKLDSISVLPEVGDRIQFIFQNTAFRNVDFVSVLLEVGDRIQFIFQNNISETGFYLRFT